MKKKTIAGLIAIVVIASVAIFAGCVEKEEGTPSTSTTPTPTPMLTPIPTATPTLTVIPTPLSYPTQTETPKKANLSVLSVKFETGEFKGEYTINCVKLRIKNDRDESSVIDYINIEISGDLPANPELGGLKPESHSEYYLEEKTVLPNEVKEIELKCAARLLKGKTYQVVVIVRSDCPPYYTIYETILNT